MGKVNPLKQFAYEVEINGLLQFLCQEFQTPELTIEEVEHTEGNFKVRTPGLVSISDATLSNLKPSDTSDLWAWNWITSVQDHVSGTGQTPENYLRNVVIRLRNNAGETIQTWELIDCWPKKVMGIQLSKTSSDNIIEEVQLVCNGMTPS